LGYVVYFLENPHQALAFWSWAKSYFKLRSFSAQPLFDFGFGSSCVLSQTGLDDWIHHDTVHPGC
jgi:hypothetical protein